MPGKRSVHASNRVADERFRRYQRVIDKLIASREFHLKELHQTLVEKPAFVTRLINELIAQGWLIEIQPRSYRWHPQRGPFPGEQWIHEKLSGGQIRESPLQDRPRERLLAMGAEHLRLAELLAILIRSGRPGESAVSGGEKVARVFAHRLQDLPRAGRGELKSLSSAVEKTAFCQIMAGIELGRRIAARAPNHTLPQISSSTEAIEYCSRHFERLVLDSKQEEFHIVSLDTKNRVIASHQITVGTLDASLVHPREVFRAAIKDAASSILLVHNHPSGDPTPSREDISVTRRLESAGKLIGIDVIDHVVLGYPAAVSIREYEAPGP
ncbi:MAG: DNA repair protein RadC [Planctomycetota bacterium]|nr:DNA repair protein RadC [Planctomycetota bacterium]